MKRIFAATTALGLALGAHSHQAAADTILVDYVSIPNYEIFTVTGNVAGAPNSGSYYAGPVVFTQSPNAPNTGALIMAWCVDFFHEEDLGAQNYTYTTGLEGDLTNNGPGSPPPLGSPGIANEIAWLATQGDLTLAGDNGDSHANEDAAAYQLAIWSVEYGADFTYTDSDSNTAGLVNTLVADAASEQNYTGSITELIAQDNQQTFVYVTNDINGGGAVPEPGSMALLGTALVGFGWLRHRRKTA